MTILRRPTPISEHKNSASPNMHEWDEAAENIVHSLDADTIQRLAGSRRACEIYVKIHCTDHGYAYAANLLESIHEICHARSLPSKPLWASWAAINLVAEAVAARLDFTPGASIHELVSKIGGTITYNSDAPDGLIGSIVIRSASEFTIVLPPTTSQEREREIIAQELGHLFLHYPPIAKEHPGAYLVATRWVRPSDSQQTQADIEAGWFASAFLMPTREFWEAYREAGPHYAASKFQVSEATINHRLNGLRIAGYPDPSPETQERTI